VKPGAISKFIFAVFLALAAVRTSNIYFLFASILLTAAMLSIWAGGVKVLFSALKTTSIFMAVIFLLHLFTHDGSVMFSVLTLRATTEGAKVGLFYCAKFVVFVYCAYIIIKTIDPFELTRPLERMASAMGNWGRPLAYTAMAFSLALRFLPELARQGRLTAMALESRGISWRGGIVNKAKSATHMFPALFVNAFKSSESAAMALAVKGYSNRHFKAALPPTRFSVSGIAVVFISTVMLILGWRS